VATFRAARGVRMVVGVGHGLVDVGRGRGGLLRSGAAGRGRRESAGHVLTVRPERTEWYTQHRPRML